MSADSSFYKSAGTVVPTQNNAPASSYVLDVNTGVPAFTAQTKRFLTGLTSAMGWTYAQPDFTDLTGSIASGQLIAPTSTTLGSVYANSGAAHKWLSAINVDGSVTLSQPAFSDISGSVASTQLPLPTLTNIGAVKASAAVPHQWVASINIDGSATLSQPAFSDITGTAAVAQLPVNVANGIAGLDSGGLIPTALLPAAVVGSLHYEGPWDASANSPALASGVGTLGYYYVVSAAGTTAIDGNADWAGGDWIVYDGTKWDKITNSTPVSSVAGLTGVITSTGLKTALAVSYSDVSGLGTSAPLNVGTSANDVVQLDSSGALPAVSGANLTGISGIPSGTVVLTILQAAPAGWLLFDDGTLGDVGSGSTYAAADAQAVFNALWVYSDANAPLYDSTGVATTRALQTDAATAWAAGCRMSLPKTLGRVLGVAGAGASLTSRALGDTPGEETHTLTSSEQASMSVSASGHPSGTFLTSSGSSWSQFQYNSGVSVYDVVNPTVSVTGTASGGGQAHNNMQPTSFYNAMVKL